MPIRMNDGSIIVVAERLVAVRYRPDPVAPVIVSMRPVERMKIRKDPHLPGGRRGNPKLVAAGVVARRLPERDPAGIHANARRAAAQWRRGHRNGFAHL